MKRRLIITAFILLIATPIVIAIWQKHLISEPVKVKVDTVTLLQSGDISKSKNEK